MDFLLESLDEKLTQWLAAAGEPPFRASQIKHWVARGIANFDGMSDLPQSLRDSLSQHFLIRSSQIVRHQNDGLGTEKLLLQWPGGEQIEGVLIREDQRRTVCISTQVGCAMGCVFCASGLDGVTRNLSAGEIIEQTLRLQELLQPEDRITHVVVMGMGEPLANLKALLEALDFISSAKGLGISARRITISTVGLPEAIRELAAQTRPYRLAVSLHAADDSVRSQLIPVNRNIGIAKIMAAADEYFQKTGRRLTFEYTLIGDINDGLDQARGLTTLLSGKTALVNLIPYNPVPGLPYHTPLPQQVQEFREILESAGISVQIRKRKGDKIEAACGQLRRANLETLSSISGV